MTPELPERRAQTRRHDTLVARFLGRASRDPERLAISVYSSGALRPISRLTWGDWAAQSRAAAGSLLANGFERGDRVAILANNRPLWPIMEMAAGMTGLITVGIHPLSSSLQIAALLKDSGARVIVVDTLLQLRVVQELKAEWPREFGALTVVCDDLDPHAEPVDHVFDWDAWCHTGDAALAVDPALLKQLTTRIDTIQPEHIAAIVYTAGATGEPKGALLSHRYLSASAASVAGTLGLNENDTTISFLSYSQILERVFGLYTRIHVGMATALVEEPTDVFSVARNFEPTIFTGLPRHFEKLNETAELSRKLGREPREAVREMVGRKCSVATSWGSTLPAHVAQSLQKYGLLVLSGYGLTEHLCVSINRANDFRFDTVGRLMTGTEVRVGQDNELLVKRSALTFDGYHSGAAATKAAFTEDGLWLRTGDQGVLDPGGYLRITGRATELIALATGRRVAPIPIELALASTPLIEYATCHGEGREFLTAVLSLKRGATELWARENGLVMPWQALTQHRALHEELERAIAAVNRSRMPDEHVRSFAVTDQEFSIESGELTLSYKVVRSVVESRFRHVLESLYAS